MNNYFNSEKEQKKEKEKPKPKMKDIFKIPSNMTKLVKKKEKEHMKRFKE